jgi:hypothetical protein
VIERFAWTTPVRILLLSLVVHGCAAADSETSDSSYELTDSTLAAISAKYQKANQSVIGKIMEAQFIEETGRIIVLDDYPPYLHLFTSDGAHLTSGPTRGDGPHQLRAPVSIAIEGTRVIVLQEGRLSYWETRGDSLAGNPYVLPKWFQPFAMAVGCGGQIVLFGPDMNIGRKEDSREQLSWFFRATIGSGPDVGLTALWGEARPFDLSYGTTHEGALFSGSDSSWVAVLRSGPNSEGDILEFSCDFELRRRRHESEFVFGSDTLPVKLVGYQVFTPFGVLALPDGFLAAVRKRDAPNKVFRTEIFRLANGILEESILLAGDWYIMDVDTARGVILGTQQPEPHFIILPYAYFSTSVARSR